MFRSIQAASKEFVRSRLLEFAIRAMTVVVFVGAIFSPCAVIAQTRSSREIKVPYTLGGSTGYFWVAYRSGAFERRGLKIQPIYIRSGFAALQSLLAREVQIELQGGSAATMAAGQRREGSRLCGRVRQQARLYFDCPFVHPQGAGP